MVDGSPQGAPIDRYVVLEYLSEGGMGAIYIGKKLGAGGFEKEVVLKQLLPEFTSQPEFIDLFLREARLSATLDHANIIHTIDLVTAGDEHFIVMEYLPGADLRTLLKKSKRRHQRFNAAAGIYIAREVLSALAYAHAKAGPDGRPLRLIHRDVSPSNILVSHQGEVKLTDFGIAKASTHNSVFYRVKGKIGYMSPEQAKNDPLDHRSDLYSLAVCLYEIISNERLFVHAGLTTSAEEIYSQPVPLLSRKISGLPPELDKVMLKALAIDPDHRYQTAGEFQEALLRVAHRHGLLTSAPELANHLRDVCGEPDGWRDINERTHHGTHALRSDGTEIYDAEGTEQLDVSELEFEERGDLLSVVRDPADVSSGPIFSDVPARQRRAETALTNLSRLQGLELTSLVNIGGGGESAGAEPLVDLDSMVSSAERPAEPTPSASTDAIAARPTPAAVTGVADAFDDEDDEPEPGDEDLVSDQEDARSPRFWLVLALLLLLGVGAAAAVGLSGPRLRGQEPDTRPQPSTSTTAGDAAVR